jgi:intracellular sulfur oxidation DsrE/DsrF family protein
MGRSEEVVMRRIRIASFCLVGALVLSLTVVGPVVADEYPALEGLKSIKMVFDFRAGSPKMAATLFGLIEAAIKDEGVKAAVGKPEVAVVFIGPSVKVISTDRTGFKPEDTEYLDKIRASIKALKKDGVKLEVCLVAAEMLNVDPKSIFSEIKHVGSGWFSVAGYQTKNYGLIAAY